MLDQNTDRMWYVIGAVLIGAVIILIANGSIPQLFASVGNTFNHGMDKIERVMETYGENEMQGYIIHPNSQGPSPKYKQVVVDMSRYATDDVIYMESYYLSDGLYLDIEELDLKYNTNYLLSYSVERVKGDIYNIGGHTDAPFKDNDFYINDVKINHPYMLTGGYNGVPPTQLFSENKDWYDVKVYITTPSTWEADPDDPSVDYGGRLYIQINRSYENAPVGVNIHNIEIVEVK